MITDTLLKPFLQVWTLISNLEESNFPPTENSNPAPRAQTWGSWKDVIFYTGVLWDTASAYSSRSTQGAIPTLRLARLQG